MWSVKNSSSGILVSLKGVTVICLQCLLLLAVSGCSNLINLHHELKSARETVVNLNGTLNSTSCPQCAVILVVMGEDGHALSYRIFEHPGPFKIQVSTKARSIFAFHDKNENWVLEPNEPYDWHAIPLTIVDGVHQEGLIFDIKVQDAPLLGINLPHDNLVDLRNRWIAGISMQLGETIDLGDDRFDPANAALGMWQPLSFVQTGLAGIYFLEPYTPTKIPVLFIHGINGTPRDFSPLLKNIDRDRFQPWFFYYPTGVSIEAASIGLLELINKLWAEHHFAKMDLIAHSMGGVVARSFLSSCRKQNECDFIRTFISISSPFGGDAYAQTGIKLSPVVMPIWNDIAEGSPFLNQLFITRMPDGVKHFMLFGYRNTNRLLHQDGDGTIPLDSQLRAEAQQQSSGMKGFNEDHYGILANKAAGEYINSLLSVR